MTPGHLVPLGWLVLTIYGGDCRVVYAIEDDRLVMIVVRVAGRGKVYRDICL